MVHVNYRGRLGNMLFEYALGRIIATELNLSLHANPIPGFNNTKDIVSGLTLQNPVYELKLHEIDFKNIINSKQPACYVLNGFFQKYEYYKQYKKSLHKWFHVKDLDVGQTEKSIIVHIRLGDCIDQFPDNPYIMPFEYYEKALSSTDYDKVFIITNPESVNNEFLQKFNKYNPTVLGGSEIYDFRAMKSFNKIVMSQSTFSWWGAFLSKAQEIYMPIPLAGNHPTLINEWSLERKDIDLLVDDEKRYNYILQDYKNQWNEIKLEDITRK